MNDNELILRCHDVLRESGSVVEKITLRNFLDVADRVRDVVLDWDPKVRAQRPWLQDFVGTLRRRRDDMDKRVAADPMILYQPQHNVAMEFHKSTAEVRYLRCGARCSKTQSGVAENYWIATDSHPWRKHPPLPAQVFIIGTNFSKYAHTVFEPKYVTGEGGNPLSPVFPEGGKWFYSYDRRRYILEIACKECAEAGKAGSCRHAERRGRIILFSDNEGPLVMQGAQAALVQLDEQIQYEIYREARERVKTVPHSGVIVTETPKNGKGWWTHTHLTMVAESGDTVPNSNRPLVSLHTIDQFSAGLTDHDRIQASMIGKDEAEVMADVFGIPAVSSNVAVFDMVSLNIMRNEIREPVRGYLEVDGIEDDTLMAATEETKPRFVELDAGQLRVWKSPHPRGQYVIGADVALGLTKRDASAASVCRMTPAGLDLDLEMVAQFHGWVDPVTYANELYKLGLLYQPCSLIVERNGPGDVVIKRLKDLGCWFLFQDLTDTTAVRDRFDTVFGIDTNVRTKSVIVSMLQSIFKLRRIGRKSLVVPCAATLSELESYIQKPSETGKSFRFTAAGLEHDDRVISLALIAYAMRTAPLFDFDYDKEKTQVLDARDPDTIDFWNAVHREEEERLAAIREMEER